MNIIVSESKSRWCNSYPLYLFHILYETGQINQGRRNVASRSGAEMTETGISSSYKNMEHIIC